MDTIKISKYKNYINSKNDIRKKFSENISQFSLGDYIANKKKYDEEYQQILVASLVSSIKQYVESLNKYLAVKKERMVTEVDFAINELENRLDTEKDEKKLIIIRSDIEVLKSLKLELETIYG